MQSKSYHFSYVSVFADDIKEYVTLKQSMGFWFRTEAENLHRFDKMCVQMGVSIPCLAEGLITAWIAPREGERDATRFARITALKGFAKYMNSKGAEIKWPVLHHSYQNQTQFVPYIFTHEEIECIMHTADMQPTPSNGSQFHIIFPAILRVLYGTGMRISEALLLKRVDVDLKCGLITVWNSKFDNSRRLPISNSLQRALQLYEAKLRWPTESEYFFPNSKGEPYSQRTVYDKFRDVLWQSGISHGGARKGPRVHDFRHTFSVHSLQKCANLNMDTYTFLPILAAYLGHKKISTTEKYLRLTAEAFPELLDRTTALSNTVIPEVSDYE